MNIAAKLVFSDGAYLKLASSYYQFQTTLPKDIIMGFAVSSPIEASQIVAKESQQKTLVASKPSSQIENGGASPSLKPENMGQIVKGIFLKTQALPSLEYTPKFSSLANVEAVIFIGSSGAGKTTVVNAIKSSFKNSKKLEAPLRYTTRPVRLNDDHSENCHVDREVFSEKVNKGEIGLHWVRTMEGDRKEWYGFAAPNKKKLTVYSANNAYLQQHSSNDKTTLVIGVYSPDKVRETRLSARSPDMQAKELAYRIADSTENIRPHAHILLNNYGPNETHSLKDIVTLIQAVIQHRLPWGEIRDLGGYKSEYVSRLFNIVNHDVLFANGKVKSFQYVERSPGVRTVVTDGSSLLMTREWREESNGWDYRLPGGKLFDTSEEFIKFQSKKPSEALLSTQVAAAAKKELLEEAGIELPQASFKQAHVDKCGAVINWDLYYFIVHTTAKPVIKTSTATAEDETTLNCWLSFDEVAALCYSDKVQESRTVAFLLKFMHKQSQKIIKK